MSQAREGKRAERERPECYISVDIEAAGPVPGKYSMLSLGACVVGAPAATFYCELRPTSPEYVPEALRVGGLSLEHLALTGREPAEAMGAFRDWVRMVSANRLPVFVGFNASFDWAFVNWYLQTYLNENPFGIGALDIKAYYMGLSGCTWQETTSRRLPPVVQPIHRQTHNALDDAIAQAEIFEKLFAASPRWPRLAPDQQRDGMTTG